MSTPEQVGRAGPCAPEQVGRAGPGAPEQVGRAGPCAPEQVGRAGPGAPEQVGRAGPCAPEQVGRAGPGAPEQVGRAGPCAPEQHGGQGLTALPQRKCLPHSIPSWVDGPSVFFITVCAYPRGHNHLCHDDVATSLWDSMRFRHCQGTWWLYFVLFMPDHVHALIGFPSDVGMTKAIMDWKHYTSRMLGLDWQRDFFDHRLRNHEAFDEKAMYIRTNPVRAGLVSNPDAWQYAWGYAADGSFRRPYENTGESAPVGCAGLQHGGQGLAALPRDHGHG